MTRASPNRVAYTYLLRLAGAATTQNRTACIIAAGVWGGHKCLFKNRDRNYTPEVSIHHEIKNGVEILYLKDEVTGWCEGMNEHGIGIVNAALAVKADEKAGKGKSGDPTTQNTLRDGKRVLAALATRTLDDAIKAVQTHLGGLRGHTLIADADTTYSLEATWRGHDFHVRKLPANKKFVRTNHGQFHPDAGYTEKDGDSYLSSLARRDQAMKVLRKVDGPAEIGPAIYRKRHKDHADPLNMVKLTDGMRTSTQMVMDLTDLVAHLYLLPKEVKYLGYKKDLPKGYEPKLTLKTYRYSGVKDDGTFTTTMVKKAETAQGVNYVSAKLTPMAQVKLLRAFPALHKDTRAEHMTVWYDPPEGVLGKLAPMFGKKVKLKVVGYAEDDKGQAVVIQTRLPIKGQHPHITVSVASGTKAAYSNTLLARGFKKVVGPTLDAVLTVQR